MINTEPKVNIIFNSDVIAKDKLISFIINLLIDCNNCIGDDSNKAIDSRKGELIITNDNR